MMHGTIQRPDGESPTVTLWPNRRPAQCQSNNERANVSIFGRKLPGMGGISWQDGADYFPLWHAAFVAFAALQWHTAGAERSLYLLCSSDYKQFKFIHLDGGRFRRFRALPVENWTGCTECIPITMPAAFAAPNRKNLFFSIYAGASKVCSAWLSCLFPGQCKFLHCCCIVALCILGTYPYSIAALRVVCCQGGNGSRISLHDWMCSARRCCWLRTHSGKRKSRGRSE